MKRILFIVVLLFSSALFAEKNTAIDSLETALKLHPTGDTVRLNILIDLSLAYENVDRLKAFDNAKLALTLAEKLQIQPKIGKCLNYLGDLYWYSSDYANASDRYFKALKIFEELKNQTGIAECYRNIGWIYQGQENYALTLTYYKKALEINEKQGLRKKLISNYDDLGIVNKLMGNYPEAIVYCKKAIELSKELNIARGTAAGYGNLGSIYYKMGKYELAIENFLVSKELHQSIHDNYNMTEDYNGLADAYLKINKPSEAMECARKAMELAKKHGFRGSYAASYYQLAHAYALQKDYTNAFINSDIYNDLKDSIYNERNSQQINEMSAKYESEKKELMISSLEKDKTISEDKLEREKNFKLYLILFCLMVAGFAFSLFRGNVQKKKANDALSHAYKEIEVKNKDITDSINYSKRIQDASLPPKDLQFKLFPNSFVLFKPKDIVSGDFYWYAEKNGKKLVAACDCTGHGVPGALMSMIGNNLLNQIVNEKGITSADEILYHLHLEVRKALKQNEQPESRDGMDVALVVFNNEHEVEFAGAQRPLWIIRQNNVLEEIKGNKFSIGGLQTEDTRVFDKYSISLQPEDCIYLFSDGFVDQFGGTHGKKFMTKNFKELLSNIHTEPMALQKMTIEQTFSKWQSNREQVDDVLVIGIKVG